MTTVTVHAVLSMDLPGVGWLFLETPDGTLFVRAEDHPAALREPMLPQFSVRVTVWETAGLELQAFAKALLGERIDPSSDEPNLKVSIGGSPAIGYEYTDGIALLRSFVVKSPRHEFVEVCIRSRFLDTGEPAFSLQSASDQILPTIWWSTADRVEPSGAGCV